VSIEASIAHSTRKLNNAQKLQEQVSKDVEKQATKVRSYQVDLETVQRAANEAQGELRSCMPSSFFLIGLGAEAQRQASQDSLSLSEESLDEYRRLFVMCFHF
jgi:structural maintenance of chromosome 1